MQTKSSTIEIGAKYSRLTIIGISDTKRYHVIVRCDCGNVVTIKRFGVLNGTVRSCGCLRRERLLETITTHGQCKTPEWGCWKAMKQRCFNPNSKLYKNYGARGITVCGEWLNDFPRFFRDMGPRPSSKHSIERIDVDGNYCPANCTWATRKQQSNNTRRNTHLVLNGVKRTISQWSDEVGIPAHVISGRLQRGWAVRDAIDRPIETEHSRGLVTNADQVRVMRRQYASGMRAIDVSREHGLPYNLVHKILRRKLWKHVSD